MPKGFLPIVLTICGVLGIVWVALFMLSTPREIRTEIIIDAPLEKTWQTLIDFGEYPAWNPFIQHISGQLVVGSELEVHIHPPGGSSMVFRPRVQEVRETQALEWKGQLLVPGLFDGVHRFEVSFHDLGKTKLVHSERFSGILVGPLMDSTLARTEQGFREMNEAFKKRCEAGR